MNTIYLDFDNTIVESNKRIIDILNNKYKISKSEKDLSDYNYNSIYPITVEEKLSMFESDEFYSGLEFKPGVLDVLKKYADIYKIIIVSKGTPLNLEKKEKWIRQNIPFEFPFIGLSGQSFRKKVDMEGAIQIDDTFKCLETNASLKILYKNFNNFPWQQPECDEEYFTTNTWEEIDSILDFYKQYNYKTLEKKM